MPEKQTIERARKDAEEGKSPSTQAGEFVREEMHHIREGKHGARSAKQAIAIGLSKARRAGVDLPAPKGDDVKEETKASARSAKRRRGKPVSPTRSRATRAALEEESTAAASPESLSRQARAAAKKRSAAERSEAAKEGAATKGEAGRKAAARKAAKTRERGH